MIIVNGTSPQLEGLDSSEPQPNRAARRRMARVQRLAYRYAAKKIAFMIARSFVKLGKNVRAMVGLPPRNPRWCAHS